MYCKIRVQKRGVSICKQVNGIIDGLIIKTNQAVAKVFQTGIQGGQFNIACRNKVLAAVLLQQPFPFSNIEHSNAYMCLFKGRIVQKRLVH